MRQASAQAGGLCNWRQQRTPHLSTIARAAIIVSPMKYQELIVLLPCHSLEDFPTHHEGEDASSLLACWSALWHPELLVAAGKAPTWRRIDAPPSEVRERLIVVPSVCASRLPTGFAQ